MGEKKRHFDFTVTWNILIAGWGLLFSDKRKSGVKMMMGGGCVKMVHISFASQKAKTDKKISSQNSQHHEEKTGTYFGFGNKVVTISMIVLKATSTRPCFSSGAN